MFITQYVYFCYIFTIEERDRKKQSKSWITTCIFKHISCINHFDRRAKNNYSVYWLCVCVIWNVVSLCEWYSTLKKKKLNESNSGENGTKSAAYFDYYCWFFFSIGLFIIWLGLHKVNGRFYALILNYQFFFLFLFR